MGIFEVMAYNAFSDELEKIAKEGKVTKAGFITKKHLRDFRDLAIGAGAFGVGSAVGLMGAKHVLPKILKKYPNALPFLAAVPAGALTGGGTMLYLKSLEHKRNERDQAKRHKQSI